MDILVTCEALLRPLQAMSGVVEKKQVSAILSHVLLQMQDRYLTVTATDTEMELLGFVTPVAVHAEGAVTVALRKLLDICRSLPPQAELRLSIENNQMVCRTGDSCFILNTLDVSEFPKTDQSDYPDQLTLPGQVLKNLFTKTYFSMGQQDVRNYLNGVLLDIGPEGVRCVAADGHRLALMHYENIEFNQVIRKIIIPRKTVMELMRLLGQEEPVTIAMNDQRLRVMMPDLILTSKLIQAQYPDYHRLINRGTFKAVGDRESIKQALARTAILSNEKFRGVRFSLDENRLCLTANNADQEHAEEVVPLQYEEPALEMAFNIAYLIDILSAITENTIQFLFSDANHGLLIEPKGGENGLYVVMPLRL